MKKTYNINISGYGFIIDEDAYEMLHSYLSTLNAICERSGEMETAADIEQRIAEIFSEKFGNFGPSIITCIDVEDVIRRMGSPEEIVDMSAASSCNPAGESQRMPPPPPPVMNTAPIKKRLYRDVQSRVLGGVCSGIGWYLGIDPVWIRVIAVILFFISGSIVALIYIILWIVIPAARSPFERMQMMGMDPSMQNVGRVVTGQYNPGQHPAPDYTQRPRGASPDAGATIGKIFLMILSILGLIVVGSLMLAAVVAFVGCIIALFVSLLGGMEPNMVEARLLFGIISGGAIVAGIPLFLLFRALIGSLTGRNLQPFNVSQKVFMAIFWLFGVAAVITCSLLI